MPLPFAGAKEQELAKIKATLARLDSANIKTSTYKKYRDKLKSDLDNKKVDFSKTRKNLTAKKEDLLKKGEGSAQIVEDKRKIKNIETLLGIVAEDEQQSDSDSSSDEEVITDKKQPVKIKESLTNGDCFYSSIYRASKERKGLFKKVVECVGIKCDNCDEPTFIQSFRNKLADKIAEGVLPSEGETDVYDTLIQRAHLNEGETYKAIISAYPDWFSKTFGSKGENLGDKDNFCKKLGEQIRQQGNWVSEIEVTTVKEILLPCDIDLQAKQPMAESLHQKKAGRNMIYLYNESEQHYQYFSFLKEEVKAPIKEQESVKESENYSVSDEAKPSNLCDILYHPCSGSIITEAEPLKVIQKKVQELQRHHRLKDFKEVPVELRTGKRLDLLLWILNNFENIESLNESNLLDYKSGEMSYAPDLFESYWDILLAMGFIKNFERQNNRYMFDGKIEEDLERIPQLLKGDEGRFYNDSITYLSKRDIKTSKIGGASDITIFYKSTNVQVEKSDPCSSDQQNISIEKTDKPSFVFCSAKKYIKEKSIDKYDILNIYGAAKKINQDEINKKILLLVTDDDAVKKVKDGASRKYISEEASSVLGQNTMIANLRRLFEFTKSMKRPINANQLREFFEDTHDSNSEAGGVKLNSVKKSEPLDLLLHQRMTVNYMTDAIKKFHKKGGLNNRFLIGILPRGGKTYIAGGLISELKSKNIVVLLGAKSETQSQFIDELFYKFINFNEYTIINVKDENDPKLKSGDLDTKSKHIFVMSIELFKIDEQVTKEESVDDDKNPGKKIKQNKTVPNPILENRPLLKLLRGLLPDKKSPVDLIISDEAHLKQATHKAEKAIKGSSKEKWIDEDLLEDEQIDETLKKFTSVPIVYMTGTFRKPKCAFNIPDENVMIWDYEDVQKAKQLDENIPYFQNSFGEHFTKAFETLTLLGRNIDDIKSSYQSFPELHLMETHFFEGVEDKLLTTQDSTKGIPDMTVLFQLDKKFNFKTPKTWHLGFQFQKYMARLINFLGPSEQQITMDKETNVNMDSSVMDSIDRICQRTGDRLKFVTSDFTVHSQLWFLPRMTGNPLGKRMMSLAGTILQHPWYREHFNIFAVSGVDWKEELNGIEQQQTGTIKIPVGTEEGIFQYDIRSDKPLKERILDAEERARKAGKGLIILAQDMLKLGISLSCVSIVVLLDSGTDVDERIQKMYRALTQSPNKQDAFVVDIDYFRTIKAVTEYQIQAFKVRNKREPGKEDKKNIINNIFNIYSINDHENLFSTKELKGKAISEIYNKQEDSKEYRPPTDLIDGGKMINENVEDTIKIDKAFLNYMEPHQEKSKKAQKELIRERLKRLKKAKAEDKEESEDSEDSEDSDSNSDSDKDKAKEKKENKEESQEELDERISKELTYLEIFKVLLRYGVFATEYKDIGDLKTNLETDVILQNSIYDLLLKKGIIKNTITKESLFSNIIIPNLQNFVDKNKGGFITMKGFVNNDSKYPEQTEEVLNYINEHLAPKDLERQKFGEIYTPLRLVDEMLDSLPKEVWTNPDLKWLDPANGMGNFPIKTFLRLSQSLKGKVKDPAKHIVENMLYMIDINGKNNEIAKKLFKKLAPTAEPNIEKIDPEKGFFANEPLVFNKKTIKNFDIIMGNPPYNPPKTETGSSGNSIWQNFVIKSHSILNDKGYLLFVHPPGWKKPTDEIFKTEKFEEGDYTKQIRQGQVWQVLKDSGVFKFIYTNDQRSKTIGKEYIDYFPAVDYYVYQKGGKKSDCDTKNIFLGQIIESKDVVLNYDLKYLPNLITKESQDILQKVTSKDGKKPIFIANRHLTYNKNLFSKVMKYKYFYETKKGGIPVYAYSDIEIDNVNENKVVFNFFGGIDGYYVEYISKQEKIGSAHHSMYSKVDSDKEGKILESFFKSDVVKFIFLITQYASGMRTMNEPLVANSIAIPPEEITDYYKFFGIEEHKKYIERMLAEYDKFKAPKRVEKTEKAKKPKKAKGGSTRLTRKIKHA